LGSTGGAYLDGDEEMGDLESIRNNEETNKRKKRKQRNIASDD